MSDPLTKKTLEETRKSGERDAASDLARKVASIFNIEKDPPFVGIVKPTNNREIGGRFFPRERAILVYENWDSKVVAATIAHELAHWVNYELRCGKVPRKHGTTARCNYKGQHDRRFYAILEKIHRELGITPKTARTVEGRYSYPNHWHAAEWR
jgi:hypothetical protein